MKECYGNDSELGIMIEVGNVSCLYAVRRDGATFATANHMLKKVLLIPVVLGEDGFYHLTHQPDLMVPSDVMFRVVGILAMA